MIWAIIFLATLIRLISLNQSLWLDEAINVVAARDLDFFSFVTRYPIGDFHSGGYFILLWLWGHLFGFSEVAVRLISVIFGVLAVLVTYLLGKESVSSKVGLLAALLLALSPLHLYYSQEARMYSLTTFAVVLATYFLVRALKEVKYGFFFYAFSVILVLYADYLAYFVLLAQLIYIFLFNRQYFKRTLSTMILGGLAFIPWMPILFQQLESGRQAAENLSGWKQVVGGAGLKEAALLAIKTLIGRISIDNKMLYGITVGIIALPYLYLFKRALQNLTGIKKLLLLCLILPPVLAFVLSFFIPVFAYFRLLFILPALYLLLAAGVSNYGKNWLSFGVSVIIISELIASSIYLFNPRFWREDWRGAVSFVEESESLIVLENNNIFSPYFYYHRQGQVIPGLKKVPATTVNDVNRVPLNYTKIYLFEYLVEITDQRRLLERMLIEQGFEKVKTKDFVGVGFVNLYEKK